MDRIGFDPKTIPPFETEEMKPPMERMLGRLDVIERLSVMRREYIEAKGVKLLPHGEAPVDLGVMEYLLSLSVFERFQEHYHFREYAQRAYLNELLDEEANSTPSS